MPRETQVDGTESARVTPARRAAFLITALAIPLAFFILLEAVLRIAGLRHEYPLFIASPGQTDYMQANPDVVKRFFARPDAAPAVNIETSYFLADKPDGALRIVVQGGSSAAGFPYGYGASLAGMLEQRLRRIITNRPVEVISTAMSAVNSYTLLDFADEIIAVEPDVVMIYAGHNEYLGVLGVGSALSSDLSPTLTRLTMRLRRYAVYQLVEAIVGSAAPDGQMLEGGDGRTLMARIARDKAIPFGSDTYIKGRDQFRGNLEALLETYHRAGIPVIVGLLASNESDLPPFAGQATPGANAERYAGLVADGVAALEASELDRAASTLDEAIGLDDQAADAWYARGRVQARRGDDAGARTYLASARDRDRLRFRAPGEFNTIVREAATTYGATVADVQGAFAAASPGGVIGNSLLLEHVHPNLDGYFLLADSFFDALFERGILVMHKALASDEQARREIPVSDVERLFGEYKLKRVVNDWPFVETRRDPEIPPPGDAIAHLAYEMYHQRIGWPQAMAQQMSYFRQAGNAAEETRVALILADALPFAPQPQYAAGTALIKSRRPAEAVRYLERGARAQPRDVNTLLALSHALVLSGDLARARENLERVLALEPTNATAINALEQIRRRGQ